MRVRTSPWFTTTSTEYQSVSYRLAMVGASRLGSRVMMSLQLLLRDVHLQAHHAFGPQRPQEEQREVLHLLPLGDVIFPHLGVGDELGVALEKFVDDLEAVGPDGAAGLGDLHDRVRQPRGHLGFRGAPGKLHVDRDLALDSK